MKTMLFMLFAIFIAVACQGPRGFDGHAGTPGNTGPVGPVGPKGADGTMIVPVPFCPGSSAYPSTFVEYGLCINNELYAVYSANGGFLAYIPDGAYLSNAIGSACNFSVSGCTISH